MDAPLLLLRAWWEAARAAAGGDERISDSMVLSTATLSGAPSSRVVLCRGIDARGVRFFTNYESRKGRELGANPRASLVFYWPGLDRQARCEGYAERLDAAESDAYFAARPRGSQLGAWASPQSSPIASLDEVRAARDAMATRFAEGAVPRPPGWGGYVVVPDAIELWENGADRIHTRRAFARHASRWQETLLAP